MCAVILLEQMEECLHVIFFFKLSLLYPLKYILWFPETLDEHKQLTQLR